MRTLSTLRRDLKRANVEDVAKLAGVSTKTVYRIRQSDTYAPGLDVAERLSAALDVVKLEPLPLAEQHAALQG